MPSSVQRKIKRMYRNGYLLWRIAADCNLTEWEVAKVLLHSGVLIGAIEQRIKR